MNPPDTKQWDWSWALNQFRENRQELKEKERHVGFAPLEPSANGHNGSPERVRVLGAAGARARILLSPMLPQAAR